MKNIQIRKFQNEDAESVKELTGISEHIPSTFTHTLKQPLTQMILVCMISALIISSKSFMLPFLVVTLLLAGLRQMIEHTFNNYIDNSLKTDLNDISETYLHGKDSCFWVAESDGRVVGMVACLPAENAPEYMELKRMSVRRTHRGIGIAKALCQTVADFTRDRGYPGVVLSTSIVQTHAQKLYEQMGYKKILENVAPTFIAKMIKFTLFEYRLDLQQN